MFLIKNLELKAITFNYLKIIIFNLIFQLQNPKLVLYLHQLSGCSVARLSRLLWEQEAAGSNPATPTLKGCFKINLKQPFSFL